MDRRDFLSTSLMAVGAGALKGALAAAPAAAGAAPASALYRFSQSAFRDLVGSRFRLLADDWHGQVQLAEVLDGPSVQGLDQFTTVFTCDAATAPPAGMYDVYHPEMGRFQLLIDGRDPSGQRLAAFALLQA